MSKPKIVVVGSANTDLVVKVPNIPAPGETVLGGDLVRVAGGKGANQAVAAARLGAEVTFVGCLGADDFGQAYLAHLRSEHIRLDHVRIHPEQPSGVALIFVDEAGENSIAVAPGANMALGIEDVEAAREAIQEADCLLTQLEVPHAAIQHALKLARDAEVLTVLNPAPAPSVRLELGMLANVDILTPNRHEAATLSGGQGDHVGLARRLLEMGVGSVVITLGDEGTFALTPKDIQSIPPFRVEAVDTTGAGDCFNAALAVGVARGMAFGDAVTYASAAGAFSVTRMGAQPSFPTAEELATFLRNHPSRRLCGTEPES